VYSFVSCISYSTCYLWDSFILLHVLCFVHFHGHTYFIVWIHHNLSILLEIDMPPFQFLSIGNTTMNILEHTSSCTGSRVLWGVYLVDSAHYANIQAYSVILFCVVFQRSCITFHSDQRFLLYHPCQLLVLSEFSNLIFAK
jgi:hypothetical protein